MKRGIDRDGRIKKCYFILYEQWLPFRKFWYPTTEVIAIEVDGEEEKETNVLLEELCEAYYGTKKEARENARRVVKNCKRRGTKVRFTLIPVHRIQDWRT